MEIPEPQNLVGSLILDLDCEDQIKAIEVDYSLTRVTITIVTTTAEQELQEYFKAGREAKNLPLLLNRRIQDGKRDTGRYE